MNEMRNAIQNVNSKLYQAEERVCEVEARSLEVIQSEENKETKNEKA